MLAREGVVAPIDRRFIFRCFTGDEEDEFPVKHAAAAQFFRIDRSVSMLILSSSWVLD